MIIIIPYSWKEGAVIVQNNLLTREEIIEKIDWLSDDSLCCTNILRSGGCTSAESWECRQRIVENEREIRELRSLLKVVKK